MPVVNPQAAGLDIGLAEIWAAVPPESEPQPVRKFETFTPDLQALADWLRACGVTTVAMESTGVYWIPIYELLQARGFKSTWSTRATSRMCPGARAMSRIASGSSACTVTAC